MMAIVARHKRLARSRVGLYEQALAVLCYGWDLRKELGVEADSLLRDLGPEEKKRLLRAVAWRMQAAEEGLRANAIAEPELLATLEKQLGSEFPQADPGRRAAAARRLILLLQERNWMLTLRGPGLYGFVHRTFLEHLCARELLRRWQEHEIETDALIRDHVLARAEDDGWREVVRLLAAQLPATVVARLLTDLLPPPEEAAEQTRRLLLALECIAEQEPRRLPDLAEPCAAAMWRVYAWSEQARSLDQRRRLAQPLREVGAAWPNGPAILDELGWPRSRLDDAGAENEILTALAAGAYREHPGLRAMLLDDLDQGDPAGRCRAVWGLAARFPGCADIAKKLRDRAAGDLHVGPRRAALEALAAHFPAAPETLRLLRDRAFDDPDVATQGWALWAMAERFRAEPETLPLLVTRAVRDPEAHTRGTVLFALAAHFPAAPETLPLLLDRAVADPDARTRVCALGALAEYFSAEPETLRRLRARAADDADALPRAAALRTLAEYFLAEPETLPFLRRRAVEDPHPFSRMTALEWLARASAVPEAAVLLSSDFNRRDPFHDPREPIGEERVRAAAARLDLPEAEVRRLYEQLAQELPIRLAWRPRS